MVKQFIALIFFLTFFCAPKAYVSVIRMGPFLEPKKADCEVVLLNEAQHILASDYNYIGMITVNGYHDEMAKLSIQIPAFLQLETCQLGGSAISLNATAVTGSQSVLQILVWAPKKDKTPSDMNGTNPYRDL